MPLTRTVSIESLLTEINATVLHTNASHGGDEKTEIGNAVAYVIRFDDCNDEFSVEELGDGYSQNIAEVWEALLALDGGELLELEYAVFDRTILLIDRVTVEPAFRGLGVGRALVHRLIQLFAHEAVVLKPFALQWEGAGGMPEKATAAAHKYGVPDLPSEQAHAKVADVWQSMGFERFGDTDIWILNTIYQHPNVLLPDPFESEP